MKKTFKLLSISLILCLGLAGCDEDTTTFNELDYPADAFVSLESTSVSVLESSGGTIDIVMNLSTSTTAAMATATTVGFTIASDNAREGIDYTVVNNKSSFDLGVGVFSDTLQIIPIDNVVEDGDKVITIILNNAPVNLGFPGPDGLGKTTVLTILDDDCAKEYDLGIYEGDWLGTDSCGDYTNVPAQLTLPCGTGITIKGLGHPWLEDSYWNEIVIFEYDVFINIDATAGTVEIPEQTYVTTDFNGDISDYSIVGTGTIDTSGAKPVITISYDMTHASYGSMANDYAGSSCTGLFEAVITLQ